MLCCGVATVSVSWVCLYCYFMFMYSKFCLFTFSLSKFLELYFSFYSSFFSIFKLLTFSSNDTVFWLTFLSYSEMLFFLSSSFNIYFFCLSGSETRISLSLSSKPITYSWSTDLVVIFKEILSFIFFIVWF